MKRIITVTADGSKTLYLPEMNEQYHSLKGAKTESEYVFIEQGFLFNKNQHPAIFEVGFGTGLNCLLTVLEAERSFRNTFYYTIEKYPLEQHEIQALDYGSHYSEKARILFEQIHKAEWNKEVVISPYFRLKKFLGDITRFEFKEIGHPDIIYFDAFAPDKKPEMWDPAIFRNLFAISNPGAVFVTYSAKGEVRRNLASAGFQVTRLPGPPGKKEMLRGIKNQSNN